MRNFIYCLSFFLLSILVTSCGKDKKAEIASYLSIDKITVEDTNGNPISSGDLDAWVYINDQFKGTFELPTRIPILEKGSQHVEIRAGVAENGVYDLKVVYPFYSIYSEVVDFQKEQIHHISPVVNYSKSAKINTAWSGADFEGGINFTKSFKSDTIFVQTPNITGKPEYGNFVGSFFLTEENYVFEAYTDPIIDVPRNNPEIWMEMDYMGDEILAVGVYRGMDFSDPFPLVYFKPQSAWKKVYIKLAAGILSFPNAPQYRFFIHSQKMNSLPVSMTSVDNVKLLHF